MSGGNFSARNAELTNVLKGDSNVRNQKIKDSNTFSKNKWLNELMRFRLKDSDGVVRPGCEWRITRRKCTMETLQNLVNRCPLPCRVDYLYDSSGTAHWMDDMLKTGMPDPEVYYIVPEVQRMPEDIGHDDHYEGQTVFMIERVPMKCKDESTVVDERTIKEYLICALLEEDPYSKPFFDNMARIREDIAAIDKKIKQVPKIEFNDDEGNPLPVEEADEERERVYEKFGNDRIAAEARLKRQETALEGHRQWRKNMGLQITQGEVDLNTETSTWYVRFHGTKDAGEMEELLLKKDDWASIRLAAASKDRNLPPWAGRGKIPDGSKSHETDYSALEVNIAGARIKRLQHGVGTEKFVDRSSSSYHAEEFGFYYGEWSDGYKEGYGLNVDDSGIFSGRFEAGMRRGWGRFDMADGSTISAPFKVSEQRPCRHHGAFANPYYSGEPHGEAEVLFADGGLYKGSMWNGCIHGFGKYQSALGEVYLGWFEDGVLDGEKCYLKNHGGEEFAGTFDMGEINGKGYYKNDCKDTFIGYFDHNLRNGRGKEYVYKKGSYTGYYCMGTKTGKGELDYTRRKKKKQKKKEEIHYSNAGQNGGQDESEMDRLKREKAEKEAERKEKDKTDVLLSMSAEERAIIAEEKKNKGKSIDQEFKYRYQGYILANHIANGGIIQDTVLQVPRVVAKRDHRTCYPINNLFRVMAERAKLIKRKKEKYTDMEATIRREMVTKKTRIFKQQKHYSKKAILLDEVAEKGLSKRELKARSNVRENRLEKLDVEGLQSKNALVPRLQQIDWKADNRFTKTLDNISIETFKGQRKPVRTLLAKVVASDFDETKERQRFLKYDNMWARAEQAFIEKKKGTQ